MIAQSALSFARGRHPRSRMTSFGTKVKKKVEPLRKKVVLVGDGACGKTSLHLAFSGKDFENSYRPTVFENFAIDFEYEKDKWVELVIWDTAGQEDYEQIRVLSYPETDVVLLCYSVDSHDSLENLWEKWRFELDYFCPDVPIVVVGKTFF